MNRPIGICLFLILATIIGCQQGDRQVYANVSGTVTYNGQPIEKGKITFSVEGRPPTTMDIVDGKFSGQAMVGSNKVSVSARRKATKGGQVLGGAASAKDAESQMKGYMNVKFKGAPGEYGGPPKDYDPTMVEYIPTEWNQDSTQMRVIEAGAINELKFDIKGDVKK
jgi:hypothetical protein